MRKTLTNEFLKEEERFCKRFFSNKDVDALYYRASTDDFGVVDETKPIDVDNSNFSFAMCGNTKSYEINLNAIIDIVDELNKRFDDKENGAMEYLAKWWDKTNGTTFSNENSMN